MSEVFNKARITGIIEDEFQYSHNFRTTEFYKTRVEVKRTSGAVDYVPIVVSNFVIPDISTRTFKGKYVEIEGEFRSYNQLGEDEKYHLILFLYVREINFGDEERANMDEDDNFIFLDGYICKKPLFRKTPVGSLLTEILLAVNRKYRSDHIPCICWNGLALATRKLEVGDRIQVKGRIQSREYLKRYSPDSDEGEIRTAYEISCISFKKVKKDD